MEQALINAIINGTVDEIDRDMIRARIRVAGQALDEACHTFAQRIKELYEQYGTEYQLLHSTVIMFYKDKLFERKHPEPDKFEIEIIDGNGKYVEQMRDILMKEKTRNDIGRVSEDATE